MKSCLVLTLLVCLQCHSPLEAVPSTKSTNKVLLGEVDIDLAEGDEVTSSSAEEPILRKCIVDNVSYSHSQTIPSPDGNSHCLCVAGEIYCWWQNYHQEIEEDPELDTSSTVPVDNGDYLSSEEKGTVVTDDSRDDSDEDDDEDDNDNDNDESATQGQLEDTTGTTNASNSSPASVVCVVMGREYRRGEVLPHSTGNCVECSCGSEGRVECSPRNCVPLRAEVPLERDIPLEVPDGDFEVFDLNRDRGIDEPF